MLWSALPQQYRISFAYCLYNLRDGCGVHIAKSVIVSAIYRHHTAEEYRRSYGNNGGDYFICLCYKSIRICKNEKKHRAKNTRKRKQPCRHAKIIRTSRYLPRATCCDTILKQQREDPPLKWYISVCKGCMPSQNSRDLPRPSYWKWVSYR